MIYVRLIGGLGNQLFQYARARRMAYVNGDDFKLDLSFFENYPLREYELKHFNIVENIAESLEIMEYRQTISGRVRQITDRLRPRHKRFFVREKHFHFDPNMLTCLGDFLLEGYWQSEKYFKEVEKILRKEFTLKYPLDGENLEISKQITNSQAVSLHIRRGDYVSNTQTNQVHGTCTLNYYEQCAALVAGKVNNPRFYIFTDDPDWTRDNLRLAYPMTLVSHNDSKRAYEDLRLMSMCKHHIIANSSFSWWGAWLNPSSDKIVCAPQKWFNKPELDTRDLMPPEWIKV